jgi:hypothetical protein
MTSTEVSPIKIQEVQKWPSVEATIIESKFSFVSAGGRNSFRGTQQIELKVRYHTPDTGVEIETRVFRRWPLRQKVVKNDSFERGKTIKLRVNPGNPKQASLIELTGTV